MQYTKAMIDLVKEARRRVPSNDKPAIKLANPDVFQELNTIHATSKDIVLKAIIKELFFLAGEPWSRLTQETEIGSGSAETNYAFKSYRGVTQLFETSFFESKPFENKPLTEADKAKTKKRIYRGQLVSD